MLKKDLILRNPLRLIGTENEDIFPEGGLGAVLARAGLGKTAFLVQLALDNLLKSKSVLHISLSDPVKKVCLWYEEVSRNISNQYHIGQSDVQLLWETILPNRLIMTFNPERFSVSKLEERLAELTEQDIFFPQILLVDGLPFNEGIRETLLNFKALAKSYSLRIWFAVRTHRNEEADEHNMPRSFSNVEDIFDVVFQLQPKDKKIHLAALKGGTATSSGNTSALFLDPSTFLITD